MKKKSILFLTDSISGGVGRVVKILLQEISSSYATCYVMCIDQNVKEIVRSLNGANFCEVFGKEYFNNKSLSYFHKVRKFSLHLCYSVLGRLDNRTFSDYSLILKYYYNNYIKVLALKNFIRDKKMDAEIVFLNQPIFLSLLAQSSKTKLIISERNDPNQFVNVRTTMAFIRRMYSKAYEMVFQSPDAMKWYKKNTCVNGRVIFNPVKPDLPQRFKGTRQKKIVNFCRISRQKNLHLLINAYVRFLRDYPEYELYIYGDAVGNGTEGYIESLNSTIEKLECKQSIHVLPAQENIHILISDYAMYVSSSDFEGMSNSMLEAMAIGLPTICTDCPAGGARAIINDHENGILVPVNDMIALANAMKEVAGNPALAEKLSVNGTNVLEELSLNKIVNQWMEIIND